MSTEQEQSYERIYFDVDEALKTPVGRIHAIIVLESYLAMLEPEERLAIFNHFQEHKAHDR
jgi:hypothetical protein